MSDTFAPIPDPDDSVEIDDTADSVLDPEDRFEDEDEIPVQLSE